jgi:site-specific DNA-methyltransferase (adenine-specific)
MFESKSVFKPIHFVSHRDTAHLQTGSLTALVVSAVKGVEQHGLLPQAKKLLAESLRLLREGGLLFIFGTPSDLPHWGEYLSTDAQLASQAIFKYWIALDIAEEKRGSFLQPNHRGLLLFMRTDPALKKPAQFVLHTAETRVPHRNCTACGQNVKDWGGKKHLLNPAGAALSDVWRDLPRRKPLDEIMPADVLQRVAKLSAATRDNSLHLIAAFSPDKKNDTQQIKRVPFAPTTDSFSKLKSIEPDTVYSGDCISFLKRAEVLKPDGAFDLVFADPPYNLDKSYGKWDDDLADQHYIEWSDAWLEGMASTLKPGGSLFVLNLPKWAMHHAVFLNRRLDFRHWIAWDALSDPRGKLMPAHYTLLWYTKPGGKPVCNYSPLETKPRKDFVHSPDSLQYCLRASCIKTRKALGDDVKLELSDLWYDIHRIRHKRDRDMHPCQLPDKLMERIIKLSSRPGDVVFDPFGGAGTTAIAALKLGRKFVVTELDETYAEMTRRKLEAMREHADLFGELIVPRQSTKTSRREVTKREIESYLQSLAQKLGRIPTEAEVAAERPGLLEEIDHIYAYRSAAFKRAKIGLQD